MAPIMWINILIIIFIVLIMLINLLYFSQKKINTLNNSMKMKNIHSKNWLW